MLIECPHCNFSKELNSDKISKRAKRVICPKCKNRFDLRFEADIDSPRYKPDSNITCPKCNKNQTKSEECVYCGVIFSKLFKNKTKDNGQNNESRRPQSENLEKAIQCIERGKPIEVIDLLGNVLSIPSKILFLSKKIDNHMISDDIAAYVAEFITFHKLYDIKVRLNQFAPHDEFLKGIMCLRNPDIAIFYPFI